mgnify:FL=1
MNRNITILAFVLVGFVLIHGYFSNPEKKEVVVVNQSLAARFETLSQNGNSSCSLSFKDSIPSMSDDSRLMGSCCNPMSMHRYSEQVGGLTKYSNIPEIPTDPYDINAGLAEKLLGYYDMELTPQEQEAYDYAMANSH